MGEIVNNGDRGGGQVVKVWLGRGGGVGVVLHGAAGKNGVFMLSCLCILWESNGLLNPSLYIASGY